MNTHKISDIFKHNVNFNQPLHSIISTKSLSRANHKKNFQFKKSVNKKEGENKE